MIIGFSTRTGFISWLIRKITKSACSHCYMYDPEMGLIYHAQGMSVHALSYTNFLKKNKIVWETEAVALDWIWLREQLGKPYGTLTLLGFILPMLFKAKNPFSDSEHSFVCSELVARSMNIADSEKATPASLLSHLRDGKPL